VGRDSPPGTSLLTLAVQSAKPLCVNHQSGVSVSLHWRVLEWDRSLDGAAPQVVWFPHTSIDTEAGWTKSGWHRWVYGRKLHLIATVAAVWIPLAAALTTANEADNEVDPGLILSLSRTSTSSPKASFTQGAALSNMHHLRCLVKSKQKEKTMKTWKSIFSSCLVLRPIVPMALALTLVSLVVLAQVVFSASPAEGREIHMTPGQSAQTGRPGEWTKHSNNPVLSPSQSWEGSVIWAPHVIRDGPTFKMWYAGGWPSSIGYATSSDGISWTKLITNPILVSGNPGDWDEEAVTQPYILRIDNGYRMWFVGAMSGWTSPRIGYATSSDGITWTKYGGNPVLDLDPGSWEETEVATPWVLYDSGTYKMWYTGQDSTGRYAIGYATSSGGIAWTRCISNPVLSGDVGTWDENGVLGGSVLLDGKVYRMWYFGKDGSGIDRIGYAMSPDGINWTKYSGNPVLDLGNSGVWDDYKVNFPTVILDSDVYKMWYLGEDGEGGLNFGHATAPEMHFVYLPVTLKNWLMSVQR
jgi:predicted GH43/DUF377 family glycosyl hydrolase